MSFGTPSTREGIGQHREVNLVKCGLNLVLSKTNRLNIVYLRVGLMGVGVFMNILLKWSDMILKCRE
jgi:hypothetical protein